MQEIMDDEHCDKTLTGKLDFYCDRTHTASPKCSALAVAQLIDALEENREQLLFETYRASAIKQFAAGCERLRNLCPETVTVQDTSYFDLKNTGKVYTKVAWEKLIARKPKLAKRGVLQEQQMRDGSVIQFVKLHNNPEGVMDFEEGERSSVNHGRVVHDGSLSLYDEHGRDQYSSKAAALLGATSASNVKNRLMLSDAAEEPPVKIIEKVVPASSRGTDGGSESDEGSESESDSASNDDSESDDVAPDQLVLAGLAGRGKAKPPM